MDSLTPNEIVDLWLNSHLNDGSLTEEERARFPDLRRKAKNRRAAAMSRMRRDEEFQRLKIDRQRKRVKLETLRIETKQIEEYNLNLEKAILLIMEKQRNDPEKQDCNSILEGMLEWICSALNNCLTFGIPEKPQQN